MDNRNGGDWKEWSQHVLIEIQRLSDKQERMTEILSENTKQLEIHIAGVRAARQQNDLLREDFERRVKVNEADIAPIKDHVRAVQNVAAFTFKAISLTGVVFGILATVYKIVLLK